MDTVPRIQIDPEFLLKEDLELTLSKNHDLFYRRIVEFVLGKIEGNIEHDVLAILEHDKLEFELALPQEGFDKSLNKALNYFIKIEEYETCDIITQLLKLI